jgi:L-alanine-DL-glutamate epimerase-like enolase superfamily enzyme
VEFGLATQHPDRLRSNYETRNDWSVSSKGALRKSLTKQTFPVVDGDISVPEEPGLGVELDEAIVAKYRVG